MASPREKTTGSFAGIFGGTFTGLARAPGRVNLIGEHTDYNEGYVMPLAIAHATWIAFRPREDDQVRLHSCDFKQTMAFSLRSFHPEQSHWMEYAKGVARALIDGGHRLRGWDGVVASDVPMGAGLSSSASFELAIARVFAHVSGVVWNPTAMALVCQRAENEWIGVQCGIMDQLIIAAGLEDHALLIDCRNMAARPVALPPAVTIMIMDTGTRRGLVESAYNDRRQQCKEACRWLGVQSLRDVSMEAFATRAAELPSPVAKRARHVLSENDRTLRAADAMKRGDMAMLGILINQSHESLRDDFEVTNHELDAIVTIARKTGGCLGARMTGAGFGGCALAVVESNSVVNFTQQVKRSYLEQTKLEAAMYPTRATTGASIQSMSE